ncbi:MAG: formylglycine-generating enzyme required for sulfatase activity/predicted Ser/Thr protein kinase [Chlamydiales bacterium]|jgi:formylglycine-generating enzyme required for sulfatase activity/predicted Ser/Thr protein kinase
MSPSDSQRPADRYSKVKAMLFEALDLEPSARAAFLDEACAGDVALQHETESLLAQVGQLDGFLDERVSLNIEPTPSALPQLEPRKQFGAYRGLEVLGYGGMGIVYLAEQENPRRPVALKLLRHDCIDESARQRFKREAQALGLLQHPGIAQIYEAGVQETDTGSQPYFAMEYVRGVPIDRFAERVSPSTKHLFALVAEVGDALQHAHDQGVLHRDLKPGNILVEATGQPKLLDFGVALVRGEGETTFHTATGQLLGTIAYMSPEQARGAQVDERSDQFSLAVILYELLAGRMPFGTDNDSLPDLVCNIAEGEPAPLADVDRSLRGDPHTILHKALDTDPRRRYPSVAAFMSDLRRYIEGQPIQARPPSPVYIARKLLARHRGMVAGIAIVAITLGLAWVVTERSLGRQVDAQRQARIESNRAQRLSHARLHEELVQEAERLWPIGPDLLPAIDTWLANADELRGALPVHRTYLAELQESARRATASTDPEFDDAAPDTSRTRRQLSLITNLEELLSDESSGLDQRMRARRQRCAELHARTLQDQHDAWAATIDQVANPVTHPQYRGLRIQEQPGLVPLGPDPDSELFEFALYGPTGTVPQRDPQTRRLLIDENSTLIFVLLPGDNFLMGAQREDPDAPNYDPSTDSHEGPPRVVELMPFFMGKYEITQGQWTALGESPNPSYWEAGSQHDEEPAFTGRNPVEHVGRLDALELMRKLGCVLPTEARWEYSARGGTSSRYWTGDDLATVKRSVNSRGTETGRDRYEHHSPVGLFDANAFGLHDVTGNVWELCLDDYKVQYHTLPLRPGDGLVLADGGGDYSSRGGSSRSHVGTFRTAMRSDTRANHVTADIGVRPARELAGEWSFPRPGSRPVEASASMEGER